VMSSLLPKEILCHKMDFGLLLFIVATLTGYLMYYTYHPVASKPEVDPRNRKSRRMPRSVSNTSQDSDTANPDNFLSLHDVTQAILKAGVDKAKLIIGFDLTASNEWQGRCTFGRNSLHKLHPVRPAQVYNPYQRVISIIGKTFQPFIQGSIWCYGFGDLLTQDHSVHNINQDKPCKDIREVLSRYNEIVKECVLSGPTSFAPIINQSIRLVEESGHQFHILVIIADGQMEEEAPTISALVSASSVPLSIILVGVGDGPWPVMQEFDDHIRGRKFDNFQFVDFSSFGKENKNSETAFTLAALMEIPDQLKSMVKLGILREASRKESH